MAVALVLALAAGVVGAAQPGVRHGIGHAIDLLQRGDLEGLRTFLRGYGVWAPVVSAALMQVQAVVAPLPSFPLMYANGLLFGTLWGGLLSWSSIMLSAMLCFGLARVVGRPLVERFVSPAALGWADRQVTRFGPFAVFLGRLVPLTSFDLLSYAAGLTPMRLAPFCVATGLGMAPAIFLTAAAGDAGWRSPWAAVAGLLAVAAVAGLVAWLRPIVLRRLAAPSREAAPPA